MNYLWSPWRMPYIETQNQSERCVFCEVLKREDDEENLIILRSKTSFVIMNRYPYTSGHVMVLPLVHEATLEALPKETRSEMMELTATATRVLKHVYSPDGFNIGINIGEASGAGIEEHIHIHVVPRWVGDTSFMTTIGETRTLPEAIEKTYQRISKAWKQIR